MHILHNGYVFAGEGAIEVSSERNSVTLYVALSPLDFEIVEGEHRHHGRVALVRSGVAKTFCAPPGSATLYADISPTHRAFRRFLALDAPVQVLPADRVEAALPDMQAFLSGAMSNPDADALHARLVEMAGEHLPPAQPLDPRLRTVLRMLAERRSQPLEELAEAVGLSRDWLTHRFRRELGISLRRYEQTLRLQAAAAYVGRGVSLTEVAAITGFADSAHLSKMWKRHYGFAPNRLFAPTGLVVDALPYPLCIDAVEPEAALATR